MAMLGLNWPLTSNCGGGPQELITTPVSFSAELFSGEGGGAANPIMGGFAEEFILVMFLVTRSFLPPGRRFFVDPCFAQSSFPLPALPLDESGLNSAEMCSLRRT